MTPLPYRPLLLVVSAPSGAGKTTLCRRLLREFAGMNYSISCTTRKPRAGEIDGCDYFFMDETQFRRRAAAGDLLEYAEVHGHSYGTPRGAVEDALRAGRDVLMDIDVQGADMIRAAARNDERSLLAQAYVDVFIAPPDMDVLRRRLEGRGQDDKEVIARRLRNAQKEMQSMTRYQYLIVNDQLDQAYDTLRAVVLAERRRVMPILENRGIHG